MMKNIRELLSRLETPRLILRPMREEDAQMIFRISSDPSTTQYLYYWGRIGSTPESDMRRYLDYALECWRQEPLSAFEYCVINRATGEKMGEGSLEKLQKGTAEIGWILLPEFRGNGYASEMGQELARAAFAALDAECVIAHCDARNTPSYRVMERLGMRFVHREKEARPSKRPGEQKGDELMYRITREAWQLRNAWREYHGYSCVFEDFVPLPELRDGAFVLALERLAPADPVKKYVPAYHFRMMVDDQPAGTIDLRIGYPDSLFYGGQIGYNVDEAFRGHGFAGKACRLLRPVMRVHQMTSAIITNDTGNLPSRRVCEKLGARWLCVTDVPKEHEMYREGHQQVNVFAFDADPGE